MPSEPEEKPEVMACKDCGQDVPTATQKLLDGRCFKCDNLHRAELGKRTLNRKLWLKKEALLEEAERARLHDEPNKEVAKPPSTVSRAGCFVFPALLAIAGIACVFVSEPGHITTVVGGWLVALASLIAVIVAISRILRDREAHRDVAAGAAAKEAVRALLDRAVETGPPAFVVTEAEVEAARNSGSGVYFTESELEIIARHDPKFVQQIYDSLPEWICPTCGQRIGEGFDECARCSTRRPDPNGE
jgi:hypothetical protein